MPRAAKPVIDVELSPVARHLGVTYIHDAELEPEQRLTPGMTVDLRYKGGTTWNALVVAGEPTRLGSKHRLRLQR